VKEGGQKTWDFFWSQYLNPNNANEKRTLLGALACTTEIWLLNRYMDMAITPGSGVSKQDGASVIYGVAATPIGRCVAWDWIRNNWSRLCSDTAISSRLSNIVWSVARDYNTPFELDNLVNFFDKHQEEMGSSIRFRLLIVEKISANIKWMETHYQTIIEWLQSRIELD